MEVWGSGGGGPGACMKKMKKKLNKGKIKKKNSGKWI